MKISVRWLRELCPVTLSDDEIARKLTSIGLEVEGTEKRAIGAGVVAARVVLRTPISGSDHLSVCQVDDGAGTHQVVCGAPSYAAGDIVPGPQLAIAAASDGAIAALAIHKSLVPDARKLEKLDAEHY